MSELDDALRTIAKAEQALEHCAKYFEHQGDMNATAHLSPKTIYSPPYASIVSALQGISTFLQSQSENTHGI